MITMAPPLFRGSVGGEGGCEGAGQGQENR
jgi:hypothetical protein